MTADEDAFLYVTATRVAESCREADPFERLTSAFLAVRGGRAEIAPEAALRWTAPDGTAARSLIQDHQCLGNPERGLPCAHGLIMLF